MEISEYLSNLGWDASKWTVKKKGEWEHLAEVKGYQNHVFDFIKDPVGKKAYGEGSRVVSMEFFAKHAATAPAEAEPVAETPPPPAVPEKLQEIAKESPNVIVASIPPPPATPTFNPAVQPPLNLNQKVAGKLHFLEKAGLDIDYDEEIVTDDEGEIHSFEDLSEISDEDWIKVTAYYNPKAIRDRKEAAAAKQKADADMEEMVYAGREKALIEEAGFVANHEKGAFYSPANVEFTFERIRKESDESFAKLLSFYKKEREAEKQRQDTAQKLKDSIKAKEEAEKKAAEEEAIKQKAIDDDARAAAEEKKLQHRKEEKALEDAHKEKLDNIDKAGQAIIDAGFSEEDAKLSRAAFKEATRKEKSTTSVRTEILDMSTEEKKEAQSAKAAIRSASLFSDLEVLGFKDLDVAIKRLPDGLFDVVITTGAKGLQFYELLEIINKTKK